MQGAAAPDEYAQVAPFPMELAIRAYGGCNGLGRNTREVVANLRATRPGLTACPLEVPFETMCGVVAGPLPEPPEAFAQWRSRQLSLALLAYDQLRDDIARALHTHGPGRVGMVLGTSTGGIAETERAFFWMRKHASAPPDYNAHTQHDFRAFANVLRELAGIEGPCYVVSTACSSSAKAFASAQRLVATKRCDAVIVGGVDSLALTTVRGFESLGVASPVACRPFSAERLGMNVGEGAALFVLERPHGTHDNAVRLLGTGETEDAAHMSAPDPSGAGAALAMQHAIAQANLTPADIDYVNAHGTGTVRNDIAEGRAIAAVVGANTPVVSTKSYTGHLLGAAGATEAMFAVVAIEQGWIPANLGLHPVDPALELMLPTQTHTHNVRHVLSNSLAFGGSNVSLVFGRGRTA